MEIEIIALRFNSGDRVQLKSGGPVMTVECVAQGLATCVWIDCNGLHNYTFGVSMLVYRPDLPVSPEYVSPENLPPIPVPEGGLGPSPMDKQGHQ